MKQLQLDRLLNTALVFHQGDDKLKKESSRDEEDNEDEGSTPKAEEYDPMEAEDADDDDDDGKATSTIAAWQCHLVSDEKSCTTLKL